MNRIILIVVCLLAAAPAMAAEPGNLFDTPSWESDVPRRFIRIDPVSAGPCRLGTLEGGWWNWSGTLLKATWQSGRFRYGGAIVEVVGGDPIRFLPVHIGYDLVHNPVKTWFFYSAVPNIYAEVSVSAFLPVIKPSLVCDLDFYGVGLRAEAGAYAGWLLQWQAYLYASAQIRLLTFGIKF